MLLPCDSDRHNGREIPCRDFSIRGIHPCGDRQIGFMGITVDIHRVSDVVGQIDQTFAVGLKAVILNPAPDWPRCLHKSQKHNADRDKVRR